MRKPKYKQIARLASKGWHCISLSELNGCLTQRPGSTKLLCHLRNNQWKEEQSEGSLGQNSGVGTSLSVQPTYQADSAAQERLGATCAVKASQMLQDLVETQPVCFTPHHGQGERGPRASPLPCSVSFTPPRSLKSLGFCSRP